jgi:hypothetical protein
MVERILLRTDANTAKEPRAQQLVLVAKNPGKSLVLPEPGPSANDYLEIFLNCVPGPSPSNSGHPIPTLH